MAYRNGTYIAFHAEGSTDPTASDIKYYHLLKAWHANDGTDFRFINSHEKTEAVSDSAKKAKLKKALQDRLDNSKNMVLIIGPNTRLDIDWVPFEISYAVDACEIPIIAAYTGYTKILDPAQLSALWPAAFAQRIKDKTVRAIHIPFCRAAIDDALKQFNLTNKPATPLNYYTLEAHRTFGLA